MGRRISTQPPKGSSLRGKTLRLYDVYRSSKSVNRCDLCAWRRHQKVNTTRMWANAQRDGRPVEYKWRRLFNAAKFGWRPLLVCRAVTLPRRKTRWNLQGCLKLPNGSQPLVSRSSPYCEVMWERYCCLTNFLPIVDTCLSCEDIARQSCAMVLRWAIFGEFLANVNSRLSSVCLSVTFVRPTQVVQIFGNISTALGTLAIHWHPLKILRRSTQGNPSAGGVTHKRGSKI